MVNYGAGAQRVHSEFISFKRRPHFNYTFFDKLDGGYALVFTENELVFLKIFVRHIEDQVKHNFVGHFVKIFDLLYHL